MFRRSGTGSYEAWQPTRVHGTAYTAIKATTRPITACRLNSVEKASKMPSREWDPRGVLADLIKKRTHIFTSDNEIDLKKLSKGIPIEARPTNFRPGDIVQAEVSLIMIPTSIGRKMKIVIRRILLLDTTLSDVSIVNT